MKTLTPLAAIVALGTLAGCATMADSVPRAEARLAPTQGSAASGSVTFTPAGDRLRVVAEVTGLTPGPHGFHVHDKGDCSAPDGTSAGGHFNPTGKPHGNPEMPEHHAGDLPQLIADANGVGRLSADSAMLGVTGSGSVIGRAVIVHAAADDFKTQPTGNSGARVACGVIVAR